MLPASPLTTLCLALSLAGRGFTAPRLSAHELTVSGFASTTSVGGQTGSGGPEPTESPSATDEDPQLQRAMKSYGLGTAAYNAARYDDALGHFKEAATLYASADFQYNIGLCYVRLDKPEEAIRAFQTYLRAKPNAPDRANVEDRIFRLEQSIAARADARTAQRPEEPEAASTPATTESQTDEKKARGRAFVLSGSVLAGVGGVVALGGGIGFGVAAASRSADVDEIQLEGNPNDATFEDAQTLDDEGRRFETLQIVTVAVGSAVAVTGFALLAVGLQRKKQTSPTAAAALAPVLAPNFAGLRLRGRF